MQSIDKCMGLFGSLLTKKPRNDTISIPPSQKICGGDSHKITDHQPEYAFVERQKCARENINDRP